jgi:hypothetical protein
MKNLDVDLIGNFAKTIVVVSMALAFLISSIFWHVTAFSFIFSLYVFIFTYLIIVTDIKGIWELSDNNYYQKFTDIYVSNDNQLIKIKKQLYKINLLSSWGMICTGFVWCYMIHWGALIGGIAIMMIALKDYLREYKNLYIYNIEE